MPRQASTGASAGDLTGVVGIGAQTAARMREAGIETLEQLARATVDQVVAACGPSVASPERAASWIQQAAAMVGAAGTNRAGAPSSAARRPKRARTETALRRGPAPTRAATPSASRRTFTVEVRVEGDPARAVTTHVVHLETQQADGWPSWDRARLLAFMERRIGVFTPEAPPVTPEELPSAEPDGTAAEPEAPLTVHRVGLLTAAAPLMQRGDATARLRLDPAELDLPERGAAVARVDLLARPVATGRDQVLDRRLIDLSGGRAVDAQLRGRLPDQDPPFAVSAIVRVLVEQPSGRPQASLGGAVLDVVAGDDVG
jgi:Helix-hairpin-helix domain